MLRWPTAEGAARPTKTEVKANKEATVLGSRSKNVGNCRLISSSLFLPHIDGIDFVSPNKSFILFSMNSEKILLPYFRAFKS